MHGMRGICDELKLKIAVAQSPYLFRCYSGSGSHIQFPSPKASNLVRFV